MRISVDRTRRGRQVFEFEVLDPAGRPAPAQTITASLSSETVASLALKLQPATVGGVGSAVWRSAAISVPDAGTWTIALDVAIDQTDAYATTAQYRVW